MYRGGKRQINVLIRTLAFDVSNVKSAVCAPAVVPPSCTAACACTVLHSPAPAWDTSTAALHWGFSKDTSRGHMFHLEVCPVAPAPEWSRGGGWKEEPSLFLVAHDRWQKEWGRQSGEGQPWLMWRQCGPKNIFPLPSILANVTCHAGHSLPCVCLCVCSVVLTYYGFSTIHYHFCLSLFVIFFLSFLHYHSDNNVSLY